VVTVRKKRGVDTHVYSGSADVWLPVGGVIALVVLIWGGLAFTRPSTTAGRDLQGQAAARADEDACAAEIQKLRVAAAEATPKPAPQRP
jgi:type II secretory pathway component PulM